jgi:hypothetical protein
MELPHVGMPNAGEESEDEVSGALAIGGLAALATFLAIVLAIVGAVLGYFVPGAGFAALVPWSFIDHHTKERHLFVRPKTWLERFDEWKDRAVFVAIALFVVLFVTGVVR